MRIFVASAAMNLMLAVSLLLVLRGRGSPSIFRRPMTMGRVQLNPRRQTRSEFFKPRNCGADERRTLPWHRHK